MRSTNVRLWLRAKNGFTNNRQCYRSPTDPAILVLITKNRGQRRESGFAAIGQLVMNTKWTWERTKYCKYTRHDTDVKKIVSFCAPSCRVSA